MEKRSTNIDLRRGRKNQYEWTNHTYGKDNHDDWKSPRRMHVSDGNEIEACNYPRITLAQTS